MDPTTLTAVGFSATSAFGVATAGFFRYLTFRRAMKDTYPDERERIIRAIGQMNKDSRLDWPSLGKREDGRQANEDDETLSNT
ncbi:hypothetical protein [Nocardia aurantiaca]|uniref:Uncharacterized protein n=1 Tax=Nocardia aurantiaca TaxID=2675850 RepID=A0A6I3L2S9_9NOCA|nr:hypothetical protein [Nocardia aurantiaca]MTE14179.1 hypothetical protein [Nocardia aurantiaca]